MKLLRTDRGLARQDGDALALLDVPERELDDVLAAGRLQAMATAPVRERSEFDRLTFEPLLARPGRFVIAGLNYRAHCEEIGRAVPEHLAWGLAPGSAVHAAGRPVRMPAGHDAEVDYEGEVAVVIGAEASEVSAERAWSVVAGLAPLNDVSARDVQAEGTLEALASAKGFPGFKPLGPCLATLDEFADPLDIGLVTRVNGDERQRARTRDMAFTIPEIIEIVTARLALAPGDVICTGTPGGVAHGGRHPYLAQGDVVEIEIEGLAPLVNRFEA
jgi:2-keto-4-pentenoate hydratase/2-oxohepta-3-ene-1,7-dioic acid hydratase in catechol pathway